MIGFLGSSVGKKYLMGLSALVWAGFVFAHMAGNMLIFVSPEAYNTYGHNLTSGNIIYVAEAVLVLALIVHVVLAISLTLENRKARGQRYAVSPKGEKRSAFASVTMGIQGSIILVFIILHLATFKYGTYYETTAHGVVVRDLFRLMSEVFHQPGYVAWYVIAVIILGFHLSHGVKSVFQSVGLWNTSYKPMIKTAAVIYAVVVAAGFLSQPIYVFLFAK